MKYFFLFLTFSYFLFCESLPKEIPSDLKITYYKSLGMAGKGFKLFISEENSYYENISIRNSQKIDFKIEKDTLLKIHSILYKNRPHKFDHESGPIHDYDGASLKIEWENKQIDFSQSGRKIKNKFNREWSEITTELDNLIQMIQEKNKQSSIIKFSPKLLGNYLHIQIDSANFVSRNFIDPKLKNENLVQCDLLKGKHDVSILIYKGYSEAKRLEIYKDLDQDRRSIWDAKFSDYLNSLKKEFFTLPIDTSHTNQFLVDKEKNNLIVKEIKK
jgi:hypothetical protein